MTEFLIASLTSGLLLVGIMWFFHMFVENARNDAYFAKMEVAAAHIRKAPMVWTQREDGIWIVKYAE
jgi:hypothetical protein